MSIEDAVSDVADMMAMAARTAPKATGKDFIDIRVIEGEDMKRLAKRMVELGEDGPSWYGRDGGNVLSSTCMLLIGLREHPAMGFNCSGCGFDCEGMNAAELDGDFKGPNCAIRLIDLGIAIGSAVRTASMMGVDNRVMFSAGVAARDLGMLDSNVLIGIPLSATGKSPYYDRK